MFTGLIQHIGTVLNIDTSGGTARLTVDVGPLAAESRLGDSIAIDGCCLTVTRFQGTQADFDAVPETLRRTTLGELRPGSRVNLETALKQGSPLGGHFVQGHVDTTASVVEVVVGERWAEWSFALAEMNFAEQIVEKGSVAVNGISLTVAACDAQAGTFKVALIPETLARTTLPQKKSGAKVNIETDILGKYVLAAIQRHGIGQLPASRPLSEERLRELGY